MHIPKKPVTFWIHFLSGLSIFAIATLHMLPKSTPNLPSIFFTTLNYTILLLIPTAISLYLLNRSNPNNTRYTKVYIILISTLWLLKVTTFLGVPYINLLVIDKVSIFSPSKAYAEIIDAGIKGLYESTNLTDKQKFAKTLYLSTGREFGYQGNQGEFVLHQPTKGEIPEDPKWTSLQRQWEKANSLLITTAHNCLLWAVKYILAMGLILLATLTVSKQKINQEIRR